MSAAGVALRLMDERMLVRITGEDRVTFLHGMCSNDIKGLKSGAIAYSLILDEHAHVIADLYVWARPEVLIVDIERSLWPAARAHLERFLVADDVEFEETGDLAELELEGADCGEMVTRISGAELPLPFTFVAVDDKLVANLPRWGAPAATIVAPAAAARSLLEQAVAFYPQAHSTTDQASEILRVEQGAARVGIDTTEKTLALEAGLERGISYHKGCYVGQETIERATARGGVKKKLCGLRIGATVAPPAGTPVILNGKEIGRATSVVTSSKFGTIGLAILHHSAWQPGTQVELRGPQDTVTAEVGTLPFS